MPHRAGIQLTLALFAICCCAHLFVGMTVGQQPSPTSGSEDLKALLKRMETSRQANAGLAAQYTFDGSTNAKFYDRKGKLLNDSTTKWVTVTIDGVQYSRTVEFNGKPISGEKQIADRKRQDAISELRKDYDFAFDMGGRNPRDYIYSDLPVSYLDTLFDNRVIGHEQINGRDNLVVESTPKANAHPGSDRAKTALDWKETTWIDIEDAMTTRFDIELLNDKKYLLSGSTAREEFTRLPVTRSGDSPLPPMVWLIHSKSGHFSYRALWSAGSSISQIDCYNYKRFQSDAHVIEDSVQEVPAPGKQP